MAGMWSHPDDFPLLPEEESEGDMNVVGLGRSPGLGCTGEETNWLGLHRSSQFGSFNEQNFNSHALRVTVMECRKNLVPVDQSVGLEITRRAGRRDDFSMVMSPNGTCRVCEYVVSGFRPLCSVQPGST